MAVRILLGWWIGWVSLLSLLRWAALMSPVGLPKNYSVHRHSLFPKRGRSQLLTGTPTRLVSLLKGREDA